MKASLLRLYIKTLRLRCGFLCESIGHRVPCTLGRISVSRHGLVDVPINELPDRLALEWRAAEFFDQGQTGFAASEYLPRQPVVSGRVFSQAFQFRFRPRQWRLRARPAVPVVLEHFLSGRHRLSAQFTLAHFIPFLPANPSFQRTASPLAEFRRWASLSLRDQSPCSRAW